MAVFDREHYFRDLLAKQVGGRTEVILPFGRADVMTDTMVWEVEPASRYPAGVRQALQYGSQTGLKAGLATYGPGTLITKVFGHLAKLPAPGVELWWLYERRFTLVGTADEAAAIAALATGETLMTNPPSLFCEVIDQNEETGETGSCDERPVMWSPMRLCQQHLDQILRTGPPIPPLMSKHRDRDNPNPWSAAQDLKMAYELTDALERLAWPHMDPDYRDLIDAYLLEVRSLIANAALDHPDGAKLLGWVGLDDEDGD